MEINQIKRYKLHLINEEKSAATIEKYVRDISIFYKWLNCRELTKEIVLSYKQKLMSCHTPMTDLFTRAVTA